MASYQNRPGGQATDEYGNPIQQLDEYGNPIGGGGYGTGGGLGATGGGATGGQGYGTGGQGYGTGTGTEAFGTGGGARHHGQEQLHKESGGGLGGMLHRSGSGSSSSSVRTKCVNKIYDVLINYYTMCNSGFVYTIGG